VGRVEGVLPRGQYLIRLENGDRLRAMIGREARAGIIRLLRGDLVEIEPFAWDPHQGAILRRLLEGTPPGFGASPSPRERGKSGGSDDDDAE
jgi:translation initiation factor IF-1